MAWGESKMWLRGTANQKLYQGLLEDAKAAPMRNAKRKKVVHPGDMPWEGARRGRVKQRLEEKVKSSEWEAGDVLYLPPNTIHQHFNADPERPARLISVINRIYEQCGL